MTDFFHEWRWQGKHMHAVYFAVRDGKTICPKCGDIYTPPQKRKNLKPESLYARDHERNQKVRAAQTTTTSNTVTLPEQPKQEVSRFAQIAFSLIFGALGCLLVAGGFAVASIMTGVIVGITLAGTCLLASISLAVLSLRENL